MKTFNRLLIALFVLLGGVGCGPGREIGAGKAVDKGIAQIEARGENLERMSVTVTSQANTTILLPVGTSFLSSSGGTQNMMSAGTVRFVFTSASRGSPQTLTQQIPVYCINRFLEAPTPTSQFSISYSEETNPVRKLAICLENRSASHRAKQIAIWMVSDHLLDLNPEALAQRFLAESEEKWRRHSTGPELAKLLLEANPNTPSEEIEGIKNLTPDEIEFLRESLRPRLRKSAQAEVEKYAKESELLLKDCGYDLSSTRFFGS